MCLSGLGARYAAEDYSVDCGEHGAGGTSDGGCWRFCGVRGVDWAGNAGDKLSAVDVRACAWHVASCRAKRLAREGDLWLRHCRGLPSWYFASR